MARLISANDNSHRKNIIKDFWHSFLSLDLFDRLMLIAFFLIIAVTPYIIANSQIFTSRAAGLVSITSGNWSDPSVWSSGVVPTSSDSVTIDKGHTINYDVLSDNVLGPITIKGTLKFSRTVNTRLKTNDNISVESGGFLDMGVATDYIPRNVKAEVIWVLTQDQANAYVGGSSFVASDKGLWAMEGSRWEVNGHPLLRTWSKLAGDALVGSTTLTVENDVNDWFVGGTIAISSTRVQTDVTSQNELRTIQSLEKLTDGKTKITIDKALVYKHDGIAPFKGEVAILTRNVLFKTELSGVDESSYLSDIRTRDFAHTMYMYNSKGNIQYAEFKYMGHYGTLGRYAIHPHAMLETSKDMVIRGNSGWYNGLRCVNLHATYEVLVEDNVCYSSSSTSYFVELDDAVGDNLDNVFVHNIGIGALPKHFDDRSNQSVVGEFGRAAVDFWPGTTMHEAFLGNVSVGDGGNASNSTDTQGWHFMELGGSLKKTLGKGSIPFTMVHNEIHTKGGYGIYAWQNSSGLNRDVVDALVWRNAKGGNLNGAYSFPTKYFNAQYLENAGAGNEMWAVSSFLQDSVITGHPTLTKTANPDGTANQGIILNSYNVPQDPNFPPFFARNTFRNIKDPGISQVHTTCDDASVNKRPIVATPGTACGPTYPTLLGNKFENVTKLLDFGWQGNANTFWRVFDYPGSEAGTPNFVLLRKDQNDPNSQGPIPPKLITAQTLYSSFFDALVTPMNSLPSTIQYDDLEPNRPVDEPVDYTFVTTADYPPTISLDVSLDGKMATMKATTADDKKVTKVEFFVDWINVGSIDNPSSTSEVKVDLTNIPGDNVLPKRKYAYLYARAFDGTESQQGYAQRAYSDVTEVGPEVLAPAIILIPTSTASPTSGVSTPTPIPTSTPTLTPTSTPTPTLTPTSAPTATPTPTSPPIIATSVPIFPSPTVGSATPTPIPSATACAITSASWDAPSNPVAEGRIVTLSVKTNNSPLCAGKQVEFIVRENDSILEGGIDDDVKVNPPSVSIIGNTARSTWISEWQNDCNGLCNPPEYYFNTRIVGQFATIRSSNPLLEVNKLQPLTIIGLPNAGVITQNRAVITWVTNKNSSSRVSYGTTRFYGNTTLETDIDPGVISHKVSLNNLRACTIYHYSVSSRIGTQEAVSSDRTFSTRCL